MAAAAEKAATGLLADLRREGIASDMGFRGNMKKRMQRANASGAQFAVIIGDDELARGEAAVKNLQSGEQEMIAIDAVAQRLGRNRSEEHTSELQSLMRISYAVFCLKKKTAHII